MAASRQDVDRWIDTAKKGKYHYIISVCDTFDYDDYPVYCETKEEAKEQFTAHHGPNMQRVNEIIAIDKSGAVTEGLYIHDL